MLARLAACAAPLLLGLASLLAGCAAPSVGALATPDNTVSDDRLVGTWRGVEDDEWTYTVSEDGDGYRVRCVSEDEQVVLAVQLVALGDERVLDLTLHADDRRREGEDLRAVFLMPVHHFVRLRFLDDGRARLWMLEPDFVNAWFAEPRDVPHTRSEDAVVLTAGPETLEALLTEWIDSDAAFTFDGVLERVP